MDLSSIAVSAREQMAWQERLANTAHQRQVADLKAAGLNPVLSAKLGGAEVPSGANDLAQLAGLSGSGGAGGSGGSGGGSGQLPGGVNIGDYINSLNPNGTTRIGKISIPNWLIQWGYSKAVEVVGSNPNLKTVLGLIPGGEQVKPEDAERALVNEVTRGVEVSNPGRAPGNYNNNMEGRTLSSLINSTTLWPLFHRQYPNVPKDVFLRARKQKAQEEWTRFKTNRVG